jgi:hypothetical protein
MTARLGVSAVSVYLRHACESSGPGFPSLQISCVQAPQWTATPSLQFGRVALLGSYSSSVCAYFPIGGQFLSFIWKETGAGQTRAAVACTVGRATPLGEVTRGDESRQVRSRRVPSRSSGTEKVMHTRLRLFGDSSKARSGFRKRNGRTVTGDCGGGCGTTYGTARLRGGLWFPVIFRSRLHGLSEVACTTPTGECSLIYVDFSLTARADILLCRKRP